jgi:hypothetical protein
MIPKDESRFSNGIMLNQKTVFESDLRNWIALRPFYPEPRRFAARHRKTKRRGRPHDSAVPATRNAVLNLP